MLKTITTAAVTALLGAGLAFGVAACGEDRGGVEIQGGTTGSTTPTAVTTPAP